MYYEANQGEASEPLSCTGPFQTVQGACLRFHMVVYLCNICKKIFSYFLKRASLQKLDELAGRPTARVRQGLSRL